MKQHQKWVLHKKVLNVKIKVDLSNKILINCLLILINCFIYIEDSLWDSLDQCKDYSMKWKKNAFNYFIK